MKFTELNLDERIMSGIKDLGFTDCTEVQDETFKYTLQGRDVAVQSQTGTGKTAAFLISIFQLWLTQEGARKSKALVVAPTRELAIQIERDAKAIGKYLPFKSACFYGGVGYGAQEKAVADGVDLIIGTPGRLLDFNQSRKLDFRELGIIVIDEADRLFDMGFYPDIRKIMKRSTPREERVTMLYSATLNNSVRNISWQFMNNPAEIEITPEKMTVDQVDQVLYHVSKEEKFRLLLGILREQDPENALIFCNTKRATEIVAKKLQLNGYPCEFIMGDLPQKKRMKIIDNLKSGELRMLCATDVAARGLHVDDLDMVVNYDLPEDPEAYVHRIGRTARAGKTGRAVSLACERFVYSLEPIQELIGQKIPVERVSADLIANDESQGKRLPPGPRHEVPHHSRGGNRRGGHRPGKPRDGDRRPAPGHSRGRSPARTGSGETGPRHVPGPKNAAADSRVREPAARQSPARSSRSRPPKGGRKEPAKAADRTPSRDSSMEDRLAYYREKYGEDFAHSKAASSGGGQKPRRDGSGDRKPRDEGQDESRTERSASQKSSPKKSDSNESRGKKGILGRLFGRE